MNRHIYIPISKKTFGKRISEGITKCAAEASIYASCASSEGLGIEHKKCQKEFTALQACIKRL